MAQTYSKPLTRSRTLDAEEITCSTTAQLKSACWFYKVVHQTTVIMVLLFLTMLDQGSRTLSRGKLTSIHSCEYQIQSCTKQSIGSAYAPKMQVYTSASLIDLNMVQKILTAVRNINVEDYSRSGPFLAEWRALWRAKLQ